MIWVKRSGVVLVTLLLLFGTTVSSPAGQRVRLSDDELGQVRAAGLFFEINLQNGFMRVAIASRVQHLDTSINFGAGGSSSGGSTTSSGGSTTSSGGSTTSSSSSGGQATVNGNSVETGGPTIINAGNVALSGNAQQNLQAVGAVNAAGSIVQLLINILVVNIQNNPGTLNIFQPQIAAFGF